MDNDSENIMLGKISTNELEHMSKTHPRSALTIAYGEGLITGINRANAHSKERIAELEKDAERWNFVLSRTELTDALFNAMPFCFGSKHINNRIDIEIEAMKGSNDVN